jgi:hypothetical protein
MKATLSKLLPAVIVLTLGATPTNPQPRPQYGSPDWYVSDSALLWSTEYSEVEANMYRFDIKPVTPATGIPTGWVIAYGHLLARPYQFALKQDTILFVNGIQVMPALRNPAYWRAFNREYARVESLGSSAPPDTLWGALRREFKRTFQRLAKAHGADSASVSDSLMVLVQHWPGVRPTPAPSVFVDRALSYASLGVSLQRWSVRQGCECYSNDPPSPSPPSTPGELRQARVEAVRHASWSDSLWLSGGKTRVYGYWVFRSAYGPSWHPTAWGGRRSSQTCGRSWVHQRG